MREEDEADDKATVEAVRTEATRAREPFMFSLWVFSINLRDLIEEEIFKLLTGEIRRGGSHQISTGGGNYGLLA